MQLQFYDGASIGGRSEQQDDSTNLMLPNGYFLTVLADGMGGTAGGALASKTVTMSFLRYFEEHRNFSNPQDALLKALHQANQSIADIVRQRPKLNGMGSTVVALLLEVSSGLFHFLSVGDSPFYCLRRNMLLRINANHAYYEDLKRMVAQGQMSAEEAENHPDRHAISSAIMGTEITLIDQQKGILAPGEFLLLASDGVQTLNDDTGGAIASILSMARNPEDGVEKLLQAVREARNPQQDNTTLIMLQLTDAQAENPVQTPASSPVATATLDLAADSRQNKKSGGPVTLVRVIILLLLVIAVFMVYAFVFPKSEQPDVLPAVQSNNVSPVENPLSDSVKEPPAVPPATPENSQNPSVNAPVKPDAGNAPPSGGRDKKARNKAGGTHSKH